MNEFSGGCNSVLLCKGPSGAKCSDTVNCKLFKLMRCIIQRPRQGPGCPGRSNARVKPSGLNHNGLQCNARERAGLYVGFSWFGRVPRRVQSKYPIYVECTVIVEIHVRAIVSALPRRLLKKTLTPAAGDGGGQQGHGGTGGSAHPGAQLTHTKCLFCNMISK